MATANLSLDDMTVSQASKHATYNEAIKVFDALLGGVIDRDLAAEPGSPSDGDVYILPASPTGTNWASFSQNDVVVYRETEWVQLSPFEGFGPFWVNDENILVVYDGSAWVDALSSMSNGADELASAEVDQLKNIDSNTISNAQWGYVGNLDQDLRTTDDVEHGDVTSKDTAVHPVIRLHGDAASAAATVGHLEWFNDRSSIIGRIEGRRVSDIDSGQLIFKTADNGGTLNTALTIDQNQDATFSAQIIAASYTVATLPTGSTGGMIHVSDETGGAQNAYYDGTNWKRMSDGATVS